MSDSSRCLNFKQIMSVRTHTPTLTREQESAKPMGPSLALIGNTSPEFEIVEGFELAII